MVKSQYLLVLTIFLSFYSTTNKMAKQTLQYALFGQDEKTIYSRIGAPTRIFTASDGAKVLICEFYSADKILTFEKIEPDDYSQEITSFTSKSGAIYDIRLNSYSNKSKTMGYQENVTSLDVFLDNLGYCVGFDYNLHKEKLEYYIDHLKVYIPKD